MKIIATAAFALTFAAAFPALAVEVRVMSAGAVEPGLRAAAEAFQTTTGHTVSIRFGTSPQLQTRLGAGEAADVLIGPEPVMRTARAAGKTDASSAALGRVGVGVVIRRGAQKPDVSGAESLERAMAAADEIVFNRASTGAHVESVLKASGLEQSLASKTVRTENGEAVFVRLKQASPRAFGFAAMTEIRQAAPEGMDLVGPAPGKYQNYTTYLAARFTGAPPAASEFLTFLNGPQGRAALASGGVETP